MLNINIILNLPNEIPTILNLLFLMKIKQKLYRNTNYGYLQSSASIIHKLKMRNSENKDRDIYIKLMRKEMGEINANHKYRT